MGALGDVAIAAAEVHSAACRFGYSGVAIKAKRRELLALLRRGLRSNQIVFPTLNGAAEWPEIGLVKKAA